MKLLIMLTSAASCHFLSLRSNFSLKKPILIFYFFEIISLFVVSIV